MTVSTVRISPPRPPKKRRAKNAAPSTRAELERLLRSPAVPPYLITLWLACATVIVHNITSGPALLSAGPLVVMPEAIWILVGLAAFEFALWWQGHRIGAIRPVERRYAFALPAVAALWALYATYRAGEHGPIPAHAYAVLVVLTAICAAPWWIHRRIRGSVLVTFESLDRRERDARLKETRRLVNGWTAYTSAGHIQGARLRGLTFNRWSVSVHVRLRNGAHAAELQRPSRRAHLESASYWPVAPGSVRVSGDDRDSRNCTIRYMLDDPHATPFEPPADEQPTIESLIIGLFETGADVLFDLVNTLIAGETRAGKSNLINRIIHLLAQIPTVGMVGVDATSGATEFKPWKGVMHVVANTADEIDRLFDSVMNECIRRGEIMARNGWKTWRCTPQDPFMVLLVDEAQKVKAFKLDKKLALIAAEIMKYGGCVIIATQYPTAPNLPKAITANLIQKIGLHTDGDTADRVIFGSSATRKGWCPSVLIPDGRKGSFLIKSRHYAKPLLARCHYMSEEFVEQENRRWTPQRTAIGSINLNAVMNVQRERIEPGSVLTLEDAELEDVVDAEIMDDTESQILDCIDRGINTPKRIADELTQYGTVVTVRTVNRRLASMKERGYVRQLEGRKQSPWFRA